MLSYCRLVQVAVNGDIGKLNEFVAIRDAALAGKNKCSCDSFGLIT